jgi:hypothetical protein
MVSFHADCPDPRQRDLLATVISSRHADNAAGEVPPLLEVFAAATSHVAAMAPVD